jgi:type I restriction enzyme, S subunit
MAITTGYKQTEVGSIPNEWQDLELLQVAGDSPICYGIVQVGPFVANGVPVLAIKNLNRDYSTDIHSASAEVERFYARSRVRPQDVLISVKGTTGRVGIVPATFHGNISRDLARIRPRSEFDPMFIFQMLRSEIVQRRLVTAAVGTTRMELSIAILKQIRIPVPPTKAEQRAIAEALSDADVLIESLEQLIAKKRQVKEGVMQELLSGKRRLQGFSARWVEKTLGSLFSFSGGYSASRDQLSGTGHCYLHYGDIHLSSKSFIDLEAEYQDIPKLNIALKKVSSASLLDDGDIVFVDASEDDEGTSKHIVVANTGEKVFIAGLHTIVAKALTHELTNEYRRYCFQTTAVKKQFLFYAVGTKVSGISKTNIAKITIPVPESAEQAAIAEILIAMDAELDALEAKLAIIREIKQGMMQELLTGRIRLV